MCFIFQKQHFRIVHTNKWCLIRAGCFFTSWWLMVGSHWYMCQSRTHKNSRKRVRHGREVTVFIWGRTQVDPHFAYSEHRVPNRRILPSACRECSSCDERDDRCAAKLIDRMRIWLEFPLVVEIDHYALSVSNNIISLCDRNFPKLLGSQSGTSSPT